MRTLIAYLAIATACFGQITINESYEPHEPIVAGCSCVIPENCDVQLHWTVDEGSAAIEAGKQVFIWAPPGKHFVNLLIVKQYYEFIDVFVPNPDNPTDPTKAILKKVKVSKGFETEKFERGYVVSGEPDPDPNPDPDPDPSPTPSDWSKIADLAPDKSKLQMVAGNYSSIGSQMSDPARNGNYPNYSACSDAVQAKHRDVLGASFGQWGSFFSELAKWQVEQIRKRNINVSSSVSGSDKLEIGKLFTDIGEGLSNAN